MLRSFQSDGVLALRQLRRAPGFALTAIVTLALGIGATTAVYSLVDGVLLRPLALPHPEQLMVAHTEVQEPGGQPWRDDTSWPDYLDWRARNHTFSGLAAVDADHRLVSRNDGSGGVVTDVNRVSTNYFDVLGVQPALGRTFRADEERAGHHVALVSYGLWQRMLGGSRQVLGQTILLSDEPYTVIGVLPQGFVEPQQETAEVWSNIALLLEGSAPKGKMRQSGIAEVVGRLRPGVTPKQAQADLSAIQAGLAESYPEIRYDRGANVVPALEDMTGDVRGPLTLLLAAVLTLLLIVCTNVAGLLLARGLERRGEMALRTALGASAWRVWRQLLAESLVLAAGGTVLGTGLAWGLPRLALPVVPEEIPRLGDVGLSGRVLLFAAAMAVACAVVSSLAPAWKLRRVHPMEVLREQGHQTTGRRHGWLQNGLVVAQTTLGVALLAGAGFLIRGFVNVRNTATGFEANHLLTFLLPLTLTRYPDANKALFYEELLPKLAALPGVKSASGGYPLPLMGGYDSAAMEVDGQAGAPDRPLTTLVGVAEPGLFETLNVPLVRGRVFTHADDDRQAPLVAMVNQAFARRYFPNANPVGHRIRPDLREVRNQAKDVDPLANRQREIVGVVADTQQDSRINPPQPMAFFPYAQASALMRPTVVLRVAGDPMAYERPVAAAVAGMDPALFLLGPRSMETQLGRDNATERFETWMVAGFSGLALFLTGLGLYSMLATMVTARKREIGVRMALGAARSDVGWIVVARMAWLMIGSAATGAIIVATALRVLRASAWSQELLYGTRWGDPRLLLGMSGVLALVALSGCLLPTWRAMQVDPARALRDE
jgi:predicted permease